MNSHSIKNLKNETKKTKTKSLDSDVNILTDIVRKDIEQSYNINVSMGTEAYFSERYGWTLRKY